MDPIYDPSLTEKQRARIERIRTEREAEREALPTDLTTGLPTASAKALVTSLSKRYHYVDCNIWSRMRRL